MLKLYRPLFLCYVNCCHYRFLLFILSAPLL
nr:MAG TPA: hypothetical protein [Caudoviricetes sp.]